MDTGKETGKNVDIVSNIQPYKLHATGFTYPEMEKERLEEENR